MNPTLVPIEDVADPRNLQWALWRAGRGKRHRPDIQRFLGRWWLELKSLREELLAARLNLQPARTFRVYDPKPRSINAPCFRERVLHHALMRHVGPILDRWLLPHSYACREGKGALAAVRRVHHQLQRWPWCVQLDIKSYFASIDHTVLMRGLRRRVRGQRALAVIEQILRGPEGAAQFRGLPIGSLTSQHFANVYLGTLDRFLVEELRVKGFVRYMDDVVWFVRSRSEARSSKKAVVRFLRERLLLAAKDPVGVRRSISGVTFCGYRVGPNGLSLTKRRRKLYLAGRRRWESRFAKGKIGEGELQTGYDATLESVRWVNSRPFRAADLCLHPAPEV